jgi:ribosome assembly protein SQT1
MAPDHNEEIDQEEEGDQFINSEDVLAEIPDDGDHAMDEDEEDADGLEDLQNGGASNDMDGDEIIVEDNSEQHFSTHEGSVFAVSSHPTEPLAASGGEDDLGYIWDITDGEVIVKLTGHTDSVTSTAFSADGEMIATGGMDGKVRVWRRVGKENWKIWEFLTELQGPDEVMWLRWHPKGNVLLAGSNDTTVWLWQRKSFLIVACFFFTDPPCSTLG